ncbi:MAG: Hsp20/alpha crystallin family protein [Lentisphaeria bacterium]
MSKELEKKEPATAIEKNENTTVLTPRVDIIENATQVLVTADLPGVSEKSLNVDLEGNTLEIKGSSEIPIPDGFTMTDCEFHSKKRYERQFTLGDAIDREKITAKMSNGVLSLVLPKNAKQQARKIEVKMG